MSLLTASMYSEAGEVDELVVIVLGELVKDLVPLRVVISQSAHVGDLQPVLLAECRRIHDGVLVDGGAGVVSFKLIDELVEAVFFHVQDALLPSESLQLISLPQVLISPEDSS